MLLHLEAVLGELHNDSDAKHRKLFLSLMENLPLLRIGYLSWVDPGDLRKMERRPIRWGMAARADGQLQQLQHQCPAFAYFLGVL